MIYEGITGFLMHYSLLIVPFLAMLSLNVSDSHAYNLADEQGVAITVSTDKREYLDDDVMMISGAVRSPVAKTPLTLQIFDSDNNLIHVAQTELAQDGTYAVTVKIAGDHWKKYGTYTVRVQYGFNHVSAQTTFALIELSEPSKQIFQIDTGSHGFYDIPYIIKGGTINEMQIDYDQLSLDLSINATSDGSLTLDMPREFMDAKKTDGSDEKFIILFNGTENVPDSEQASVTSRNITINFLHTDSKIKVIGTQIVPEFSSVSSFVLLISVILVVLTTVTSRVKVL